MKIHRLRNLKDANAHRTRSAAAYRQHHDYLMSIAGAADFTTPGYSYPAGRMVDFLVKVQPDQPINWRETVSCPVTHMNNRMRATSHLFDIEMDAYDDSAIYLSEQVTPIYKAFAKRYRNLVGSEFLGAAVPLGAANAKGVRNEDLCALTFGDESLDCIVSLDVLEHVPTFREAFGECFRCLRMGGRLMWSVPFNVNSPTNSIRASLNADGSIVHHLPAQYHGDPLSKDGVLCFTTFGWEMLDEIKDAGFRDAYAVPYQSIEFGHLGPESLVFFAYK